MRNIVYTRLSPDEITEFNYIAVSFKINPALGNNFIYLTNALVDRGLKSQFNGWLCSKIIKPVLQCLFAGSTFVSSN